MPPLVLTTRRSHQCTIEIESGLHEKIGERLKQLRPAPPLAALVSDRDVAPLWLGPIDKAIKTAGIRTLRSLIPVGEAAKSLTFVSHLWDRFITAGLDRDGVVVAVGGGVVGDVAGFAASTFKRGIRLIQVPTTLLAQVDSAIGGKNGINRSTGKNLVGTIVQPQLVLIDPLLLHSLPDREVRSGLGEVIKYGLIRDPRILDLLETVPNVESLSTTPAKLEELIHRCVAVKVDIVAKDELEMGERAVLNFGHTVAHALESAHGFTGITHGEAVGIGMLAVTFLSIELGHCDADLASLLSRLLRKFGMPTGSTTPPTALLPLLQHDKKRAAGRNRWVLVTRPGETRIVEDPPVDSLIKALEAVHQPSSEPPADSPPGATEVSS